MSHPGVDTSLFRDINNFARDTHWLHSAMVDYAKYGVALFVVLIAAGAWLGWRDRSPRRFAAAGWAGAGTRLAMGRLLRNRRLGVLAWTAAVLLAFSRVCVGAHYPQDVLAGLALGALVSGLGWLLIRRPTQWLVIRIVPGMRTTPTPEPEPHTAAAPSAS